MQSISGVVGVFSRALAEGEWLRSAERVWDDVQDSAALRVAAVLQGSSRDAASGSRGLGLSCLTR